MRKSVFVAARKALFVGLLLTLPASPVVLPVFVHPAQAITQAAKQKLKKGMTPKQVQALLGKPKFTNTTKAVTQWVYVEGDSAFGVNFSSGKVVAWGQLEG